MVLINMDTVYELTILLCGLHRGEKEREGEEKRVDGTNRECMQSLLPNMKRGVSERKESTAAGRAGGEAHVGVAENRRRKDTGERRGGY